MMMIRALLGLGVCCLALAGCDQLGITSAAAGHTAASSGVFTNRPYTAAETQADNSGKVFLVDATAAWCGPCKIMDRTTWKDPRVVSWISDNAVAVQVDVDRHPKLARQLRINAMPTIIVFRDGRELNRVIGYRDAEQLVAWLDTVAQ